jgi:hypothetical protein
MSKFSSYTESNIISTTLRGAAFPVPSNVYVALFTADPGDAFVAANEVQVASWPAYVREDAAQGGAISTGWTAPSGGSSSNAKTITFPANNGAGAVTITHVGLVDAASGGNLLYHAPLVATKTLQVGDVLSFAIGSLVVTVS